MLILKERQNVVNLNCLISSVIPIAIGAAAALLLIIIVVIVVILRVRSRRKYQDKVGSTVELAQWEITDIDNIESIGDHVTYIL